MITLGFKNKFSGWLRAFTAIILGIIMVVHPGESLTTVVKVLAAFLIAAGIVSLIYGIINRERGALGLLVVNALVDFVLGGLLFAFAAEVLPAILFLIGLALALFGLWEFIVLISARIEAGIKTFMFFLPIICVVCGFVLMFNPKSTAGLLVIVAGIATILYGVSEMFATWRMNRAIKAKAAKITQEEMKDSVADAPEAEYEKVEDEAAEASAKDESSEK